MSDNNPSLFELNADYINLYNLGYDPENEEAFNTTLEVIKTGIAEKIDAYCSVMTRFDGEIEMIKAEENRLEIRKKTLENSKSRMLEALKYVLMTMEEAGEKPEILTPLHKVKLVGNGGKQPMDVVEERVPDNFKKIIYETDKDKIRKALEAGEDLDFATLKPRGRHVKIS